MQKIKSIKTLIVCIETAPLWFSFKTTSIFPKNDITFKGTETSTSLQFSNRPERLTSLRKWLTWLVV